MLITNKFANLKEEILQFKAFEAKDWQEFIHACKKLLQADHIKQIKPNGNSLDVFLLKHDAPISEHHIQSIKLYTDYGWLCTVLCEAFRLKKISEKEYETVQSLENRNQKIANWCRLLMESVQSYGNFSTTKKYYRGLDKQFIFKKFLTRFNVPLSTTTDFGKAVTFADGSDGLVMELTAYRHYVPPAGFDCSLVSVYDLEKEILFFGGDFIFQIRSVFQWYDEKWRSYRSYISGIQTLMSIANGSVKWNSKNNMKDIIGYLIPHLYSRTNPIPPYITQLLDYHLMHIPNRIEYNFAELSHQLQWVKDIFVKDDAIPNVENSYMLFKKCSIITFIMSEDHKLDTADCKSIIADLLQINNNNICIEFQWNAITTNALRDIKHTFRHCSGDFELVTLQISTDIARKSIAITPSITKQKENITDQNISCVDAQTLKSLIEAQYIDIVKAYINTVKQNVSEDIADLILFFYAKPIMMKMRYRDQIKSIWYLIYEPEWKSLENKIVNVFGLMFGTKITKLAFEHGTVTKSNWDDFRWKETNIFRVYTRQRIHRIQSEPAVSLLTQNTHTNHTLMRGKSTVWNPSDYYRPRRVLELMLSQPSHACMGVGPNLRPLIELTLRDLQQEFSDNTYRDNISIGEEAILRLEIEEFEPFVPLTASITNFEIMLNQTYTSSLIKAVFLALIGSFLSGYNTSLLNVPGLLIQSECNLSLKTYFFLQSSYCLGGLFGALIVAYLSNKHGRKSILLFANCMFMLSGVISMLYSTKTFGPTNQPFAIYDTLFYFIMSRFISGLASGMSIVVIPMYLGEISPAIIRGEIGTLNAFINAFGIFVAELIGFKYLLGNNNLWQFIFIINIIPCILQLIFIKSLCESPQWLLLHKYEDRAEEVFKWLRQKENVDFDMRSIKTVQIENERSRANRSYTLRSIQSQENIALLTHIEDSYGSITVNNQMQKMDKLQTVQFIYICFMITCLQLLQQLSGINSIWYYSSITLRNAGLQSSWSLWIGNLLIACSNMFGVLVPVYVKLIDRLDRKTLIYLSCLGMAISSIMLSVLQMFAIEIGNLVSYLSIIAMILYVMSFGMGLGQIVGLLTLELSPSSHRETLVSAAFVVNYSANLFVAQYSNFVIENAYYLPFSGICLLGIIFTYLCVPETKGKTENSIQSEILRNYVLFHWIHKCCF